RTGVTSKGGTYARMFTTGVSFGIEKPWEQDPAWVGTMHGPDEAVSEELLKQAFAIYARTLGNLMQLDL
ncbi:MAG: peptidase M20, partial [Eggerthellaceae bacterium]|nr:peptidase M20 [Eggerthellaceae bacterium]